MAVKYLVPDGKHLPYTDESGKPDHHLMGAAWAALHGGYRGNKYEGPDKEAAIARLRAIYKSEGMAVPNRESHILAPLLNRDFKLPSDSRFHIVPLGEYPATAGDGEELVQVV